MADNWEWRLANEIEPSPCDYYQSSDVPDYDEQARIADMSGHTKGDWETTGQGFVRCGRRPIALVSASHRAGGVVRHGEEDLANARLIAAAPELLQVARLLVEAMRQYEMDVDESPTGTHRRMMERATATIAKATGETE